jgi:hypothetical protein
MSQVRMTAMRTAQRTLAALLIFGSTVAADATAGEAARDEANSASATRSKHSWT